MTESAEGNGWSDRDRVRIAAEGLSVAEADRQMALFRQGLSPVRLNRACRVGDGIVVLAEKERPELLRLYDEAVRTRRLMKFVPASGGATRMFQEWYRLLAGEESTGESRARFWGELPQYPFFPDLKAALGAQGMDLENLLRADNVEAALEGILTDRGLGYGLLPKALLKFHAYPEGARTALEEHLVEAALYARDGQDISRLHFTLSPEHEKPVRELLASVTESYEARWDTAFDIGLSMQDRATNTLAADPACRPFRDAEGGLVFRPGGHGALLANLNALEADIVFVKNIDNCAPDRLKAETVVWKRLLAAYLWTLQEESFAALRLLDGDDGTEDDLQRIAAFARGKLNAALPACFGELSPAQRRRSLFEKLNRPLRVCGMVKNDGEPGGGPFWVDGREEQDGPTLQIVEAFQVDWDSPSQKGIWASSTHFNPVDLVCGIRNFRGEPFALGTFVDPQTASLARKSDKGRPLLALERPGLWNGSMAFWNTVFVEVPLSTFNPVKNVTDLLRPQHLPD
ncbi:MAG: DUF4301 family protein [Deltaproteobacteria bacterium]|nr:DUF4301 family protein [Deltaproteobacteria bacterium]